MTSLGEVSPGPENEGTAAAELQPFQPGSRDQSTTRCQLTNSTGPPSSMTVGWPPASIGYSTTSSPEGQAANAPSGDGSIDTHDVCPSTRRPVPSERTTPGPLP